MRSTLIVSAFAALALAAPRPQEIEFDLVDAAPAAIPTAAPVTGTSQEVPAQPAAAAAAIGTQAVDTTTTTKRRSMFAERADDGDCSAQPAGTGPAVNAKNALDDSADSFLKFQQFHDTAQSAVVPQGYTLADGFVDLQASSNTMAYQGYKTLSKYDPILCQQYCDADSGCTAFNIYFERDPTQSPNKDKCPNPASLTNIKCVKWGVQLTKDTATNTGETRDSFQVVVAGSNGYNKIAGPPKQPLYTAPTPLGGAINAPNDPTNNTNTYAGYKYFSIGTNQGQVQTYNDGVTACLAAADTQSAYNRRHTTAPNNPAISNQVVTYVLSKNNMPQGVYCAIYTEAWASQYATNVGQYRGSDYYSVSQAYSFVRETYAAKYPDAICAVGGCPAPAYRGGGYCYGETTC